MQLKRNKAFSLLEALILISILGILVLIAFPSFRKMTRRSEAEATAQAVRSLVDAIEFEKTSRQAYPDSLSPDNLTPEMVRYLPDALKDGTYNWSYQKLEGRTFLHFNDLSLTPEQLIQIDAALDDGNPTTGNVQVAIEGAGFYYILDSPEPNGSSINIQHSAIVTKRCESICTL